MTPGEIQITVAPQNGRAQRLIVATVGTIEHRDKIDPQSATARKRFTTHLANRLGVEVTALADLDARLIKAADEADAAADKATRKNSKPAFVQASQADDELPSILADEGRTELSNARRLVRLHGEWMRWCGPWKKWLIWDGMRWEIDEKLEAEKRAKSVYHLHWQTISMLAKKGVDVDTCLSFAKTTGKDSSLSAMLKLARSEGNIPILPAVLDSDPWFLNVLNGTLDLRTGELRPHRKEDYLTKLVNVAYDPSEAAPTWLAFLLAVFDGDVDMVSYIQRLLGYCLTGRTTEHILPICHGVGSNGKSTLLKCLLDLLGEYAHRAPSTMLLTGANRHPTEQTGLYGRRLVVCLETEDGKRLAESLVKELTGGDVVTARRMREDFWTFEATHKLILCTNHKPLVRGTDHAIWRRLRLIPFNVKFWDVDKGESGPPELKADKGLPDKLKVEHPGILAWLVQGCIEWQRGGMREPEAVMMATAQYRSEQDIIGAFVADVCIEADWAKVKVSSLYAAFKTWAAEAGEYEMSQRRFGTSIDERGHVRFTSNGTWYRGICLRSDKTEMEGTEPWK